MGHSEHLQDMPILVISAGLNLFCSFDPLWVFWIVLVLILGPF